MRFRHQLRYDAPPAAVYAMLGDPAFRERVAEEQNASEWDVAIDCVGDGMTVAVDQKRPSHEIPSFARKIAGDQIHIAQRERWRDPTGGEYEIAIPHKPGHLKGTITLEAEGTGTLETVSGDLTVNLPLIGGKMEGLIAEVLQAALRTEQRVGAAWLGGDR